MTSSIVPVKRRGLAEQIIGQLNDLIDAGTFAVGDKLPSEPELMEKFGVGRTTVREAIRVLAHAGRLEVRQGDGTYVRAAREGHGELSDRLRSARVIEVYEVRRALELEIVRLSAVRREDDDLDRMQVLIDRLTAAADADDGHGAFLDADMELHQLLARSTKNQVLIDVHTTFASALREAVAEVTMLPGVMEACVARHERVLEALRQRDAGRAEEITAQYLQQLITALAGLLDRDRSARSA
jgi:DNA-binding FadR family transcriptional regulator